nr:immunoglobulin light chain junction region [Macaca mulatta]MPO14009.1 immunoglobulin light chain junction region [Macaca mulatta]
CMMWHNNAYIF